MNIRNRRDNITFKVLVVLIACWLVFLLWKGNRDRSGPCVFEHPRHIVDEVCTESICVTEKEYKLFMRVEK